MVSFGICSPELAPNAPFMASAEVLEPRNWGPGGFLLLTSRQLGHAHITAEQPGHALGSKNNCQNQNICNNTISPLIQEYHHEQSHGADSAFWIMNLNLTMLLNWAKGLTRRRQWHPTPVLLPGKPHGRRSLVGYSPWGCKESDTTEQLHFHFSLSCIGEGNGNPLQCSCLENPRDGEAWWAGIYGVTQSQTRLKWLSSSSSKGLTSKWTHLTWFIAISSTLASAQRFPMASAAPESVSLMCLHLTSDLSFSVIFSCSLTGNPTAAV